MRRCGQVGLVDFQHRRSNKWERVGLYPSGCNIHCTGTLSIWGLVHISMVLADVLVPNRRQATNHHLDSTVTIVSYVPDYATRWASKQNAFFLRYIRTYPFCESENNCIKLKTFFYVRRYLKVGVRSAARSVRYGRVCLPTAITPYVDTEFVEVTFSVLAGNQVNTLIPRKTGWHFADNILKLIFPEWKLLHFDAVFTDICCWAFNRFNKWTAVV